MANDAINTVRAVLGQGLAFGFGDEAEAWLRSKLGDEEYEKALTQIRGEYGTFAKESPYLQLGGEILGGTAPAIASLFVPGGQAAAPGALTRLFGLGTNLAQRTFGQNLARVTAASGAQGALSGAGTSTEGDRGRGALVGGLTGGVLGATLPVVGQVGGAAYRGLRQTFLPSTEKAREWAVDKLRLALDDVSPAEINQRIAEDIRKGVPPAVANVTPGTMQLAESVVQRGEQAGRALEEVIEKQKEGSISRVAERLKSSISPKNYYAEDQALADNLRRNAQGAYDSAYAVGEINDPMINLVLQEPEFKAFFEQGKSILKKHRLGETLDPQGDPSKYQLKEIYDPQTGKMINLPDVRTLDYIKQGIDEQIDELYKANKSKQAYATKVVRDRFVNRLDELVPEYKAARAQYKGDIEILDALRMGKEDFTKMAPEEVTAFMQSASAGERDAFRVGVARRLYDVIATPTQDINAAKRIIGGLSRPEAIGAIFESPAERDFFMEVLKREDQLYRTANKILAGSPTYGRGKRGEKLEASDGLLEGAASAFTQGSTANSMLLSAAKLLSKGVPDSYYEELSKLLKTGDPADVAAVVNLLEDLEKKIAGRKARLGVRQAAYTSGTVAALPPAPLAEGLTAPTSAEISFPEVKLTEEDEEEEIPLP